MSEVPTIATLRAKLEDVQALLAQPVLGLDEDDRAEAQRALRLTLAWVTPDAPDTPAPEPADAPS